MNNCPKCGGPLSSKMKFCRACGTNLALAQKEASALSPKRNKRSLIVIGVVVCVLVVFVLTMTQIVSQSSSNVQPLPTYNGEKIWYAPLVGTYSGMLQTITDGNQEYRITIEENGLVTVIGGVIGGKEKFDGYLPTTPPEGQPFTFDVTHLNRYGNVNSGIFYINIFAPEFDNAYLTDYETMSHTPVTYIDYERGEHEFDYGLIRTRFNRTNPK